MPRGHCDSSPSSELPYALKANGDRYGLISRRQGMLAPASDHRVNHQQQQQSLNREGRWGTTDDFTTSFLHFSPSSEGLTVTRWTRPSVRHRSRSRCNHRADFGSTLLWFTLLFKSCDSSGHCPLIVHPLTGGGGFFLACQDFGRRLGHSIPASTFFFFFEVEISSRALIPLLRPGSVHSGSARWDERGPIITRTLKCLTALPILMQNHFSRWQR